MKTPHVLAGATIAIVAAFTLILPFAANAGSPATWYVNASAAANGDGTTSATATTTIQAAINAASPGDTIDVAAGTYTEDDIVNKAVTIDGATGAKLVVVDGASSNGFDVTANDVTIEGFDIDGPVNQSYQTYPWSGNVSRGIVIENGVTTFTITDNTIQNLRNDILIDGRGDTGSFVTDNVIDNSKSGISIQYTDGNGITITGNTQGTYGNDWGVNLHLNGYWDGTTVHANPYPGGAAPAAAQTVINDNSAANADWTVQDQAYTSSNRTAVTVATTGTATAQGDPLGPINTIQNGVNAVAVGGTVNVENGAYSGAINVTENGVQIIGQSEAGVVVTQNAGTPYGDGITVTAANGVGLSDMTFITPAGAATAYALHAYQGSDLSLSNLSFTGAGTSAEDSSNKGFGGVDINSVDGVTIDNVSASDYSKNGFSFTAQDLSTDPITQNIALSNITSTGNAWDGIAFYTESSGNNGANIDGVTFSGTNTITDNSQGGIYFEGDTDTNFGLGATPRYTVTGPSNATIDLSTVAFSSDPAYDIINYQTAPVNAIGATFDPGAITGDQMTAAEQTTENGKILDHLDNSALGLVSYYTPDTQAPVVTVSPVAGSLLHGTETFTITVTDNKPLDPTKNTHIWVYLYNNGGTQKSQGANVDLSSGTGTFTVDTTKLDDGTSTLDVGQVQDAAGNKTVGDTYFKNYVVDNTAPVVTVTPVAGSLLHGTETFNITITDAHPATSTNSSIYVYLYNNGGTQKSQGAKVDLSSGTGTFTVDTTKLNDGTSTLDVGRLEDAAGNYSGTGDTYFTNYVVDNTPPVVTVTPAAGSTLSGTETFNITVTDNNPLDPTKNGSVWVYLYNNAPPQTSKGAKVNLSNGTGTFTVDTTLLENGTSTLDVGQVFDAAGNPNGSGDNYFKDYTIDNVVAPTAATLSITAPAADNDTVSGLYDFTADYENGTTSLDWAIRLDNDSCNSNGSNVVAGNVDTGFTGANATPATGLTGPTFSSTIDTTGWANGNYCFIANDLNGQRVTRLFTVDNTPVAPPAPSTVTVTIDKYIDGVQATAANTNSTSFPMTSSWTSTSLGNGNGSYDLGTDDSYQAVTSPMNTGSTYTTNETVDGTLVGSSCGTGATYALAGYTTGDSLADAAAATPTPTAPNFSDLENNEYVIVWNQTCAPTAPILTAPGNGATISTSDFDFTWDAFATTTPVTYEWESSLSSATNPDGSFQTQLADQTGLTSTTLDSPSTPNGTYYWHVRATDGDGNVSPWSATWSVTVNTAAAPPTAPVAVADSATTDVNTPVTIDVLANDTGATSIDPAQLTQPTNGTATINGNEIVYTPDTNYSGPDSFTYEALNAVGDSNSVTVSVTVVDTSTPVLTVVGNNPDYIEVNSTYVDQGVTISDVASPNIGYVLSLDGEATTSDITTFNNADLLSTSTPGTHTILYAATNGGGNTGYATRTVVVLDPLTITLTSTSASNTSDNPIPVTATFSEPVENFTSGDITVTNGSASNVQLNAASTTATFDVLPSSNGAVTVVIPAGDVLNMAGVGTTTPAEIDFTYAASNNNNNNGNNGNNGNSGGGIFGNGPVASGNNSIYDLNHDGHINLLDFNILISNWGKTGTNVPGDFNGDGVVNILDLNLFLIHWLA